MLKIVPVIFFLLFEGISFTNLAIADDCPATKITPDKQAAMSGVNSGVNELSFFDATKLANPPKEDSPNFELDKQLFQQGKGLRNTERGKIAVDDADFSNMPARFSKPLGIEISKEKTPALFYMFAYLHKHIGTELDKKVKPYYNRVRPFVLFNEHTCQPKFEEELKNTSSYPSGHSCMGWALGLILAEMLPEKSTQIIQRGYEIGQSRVICGYHWQSDVDISRLIAAGFVANLHTNQEFRDVFEKTKEELRCKVK